MKKKINFGKILWIIFVLILQCLLIWGLCVGLGVKCLFGFLVITAIVNMIFVGIVGLFKKDDIDKDEEKDEIEE